jgi:monovalent cation/hydrogen antiporter
VHGAETALVGLLLAVAVLGAAARAVNIPYPIVLVAGGLGLGLIPGLPHVTLDPDLVLVVFLPPLLYSAAFFASLRDLRADLRVITLLAVGLVLATGAAVGLVAHAVVPGMPWAVAFTLGAIVAPTDPVAAATIARRLGVPRRTINVLEGEGLLNDGTALVAYRVAVGAATSGSWSAAGAGLEFLGGAAGGIAIGLVVGWIIAEIRRRLDDTLIETTISLLTGYVAYIPAERAHCSGVLAVVAAGIMLGFRAPGISSASQRIAGYGMWELLTFLLNATLFVLVGLQLRTVVDGLSGRAPATLVAQGAAVAATVIGTRLLWGFALPVVIRTLDRRPGQRARRANWRERLIGGWSGMRGAVSLAAALALTPDFPYRDIVVFLTFVVILVTLQLQGLSLPWLIRRLDVHDDGAEQREELIARRRAVDAAMIRLDELALQEWTREDTVERMRAMYDYRRRRLAARDGDGPDDDGEEDYEARSIRYQKMVREVLEAQHTAIVELRNRGRISNDVMHRLERELDLERERLEI